MCELNDCIQLIRANLPYIQKEYGVTGLSIFGSLARGDNKKDSDIDILVDMPPKIILLFRLNAFLEKLLNASVDLVRRHSHLSIKFQNQISQDAITVL